MPQPPRPGESDINKMVLDEETRQKIELNRLEALKRLEERKRRLENDQSAKETSPPEPKRLISAFTPVNSAVQVPKTPLPLSNPTPKLHPSGSGIRPLVQLVSSSAFSITGTNSIKTICRNIITQVIYNRIDNTYTVPLEKYNELLEKLPVNERPQAHYQIPKTVLLAFDSSQVHQRQAAALMDYQIEATIGKDLYNSLFPYQREGVKMAIARRGRLIIADEMGLGKSIQAIATAMYFRREWPLLILAPASMVASWQQQILRWIPENLLAPSEIQVIYDGKTKSLDGTVTILSYDLAVKFAEMIQKRGFGIVIADECHVLRNIETKRSKTLIPIISAANRTLLLSGTPALSRPIELFPQIQVVNPKLFPKRHEFAMRYCDAHKNYFGGWDMRGSSNLTELQLVLENCVMIRRMKDQVLTELPPKIRRQIFLKVPTSSKNFKMFQLQTTEYLNNIGLTDDPEAGIKALEAIQKKAEFMALWKQTAEIKLEAMVEYVEDLLEADHKMLIFAHHTSIIDGFTANFISKKVKYIRIDGRTPPSQRQDICTAFQTDPEIRIALLSITAASTGLTLTKATTVIFAELFFNPGIMVQAEDRAHRIGQLDSVNVHYLLAKGTTDDQIWPLILRKLNTLESVGLGKNDFKDISSREHDQAQSTIEKFFKPAETASIPTFDLTEE